MLTLSLDLTALEAAEDAIVLQMPNGDRHVCTEDECDCLGSRYGNICKHRFFIFAMGGFDELKKLIKAERRKAAKLTTNSTAPNTHPKGHDLQ